MILLVQLRYGRCESSDLDPILTEIRGQQEMRAVDLYPGEPGENRASL